MPCHDRVPAGGRQHDLRLNKSGCQGFCQMGPLVTILPEGILYNKVKAEDVAEIVSQDAGRRARLVERLLYVDPATKKRCRGTDDIPFYQRQQRFVLQDCGIDRSRKHRGIYAPRRLRGGAQGVLEMTPEQICQEITQVRPARPRRRRVSDRPQMGSGARAAEREEIRHLQRRRRRPRRVHEPQRDGRQPAQRARRA